MVLSGDYTKSSHHNGAEVLTRECQSQRRDVNGLPLDSRFICGSFCNYETHSQPAATFNAGFATFPLAATSRHRSGYARELGLWPTPSSSCPTRSHDFDHLLSELRERLQHRRDLSPANTGTGNETSDKDFSQELRLGAKIGEIANLTVGRYLDEKAVYYTLRNPLRLLPLQFIDTIR